MQLLNIPGWIQHVTFSTRHGPVTRKIFEAKKVLPGEVAWKSPKNGKLYIIGKLSESKMKRVAGCDNIKALVQKHLEQERKDESK